MDLARGRDADAGDARGLGGVDQAADHALEVRQDSGRAFPGFGLHFEAPHELTGKAHESAAQLAAPQVNPDGVAIRGHRRSRRGK
jgi:hypothetical protein